jgi:hypothetical protein
LNTRLADPDLQAAVRTVGEVCSGTGPSAQPRSTASATTPQAYLQEDEGEDQQRLEGGPGQAEEVIIVWPR